MTTQEDRVGRLEAAAQRRRALANREGPQIILTLGDIAYDISARGAISFADGGPGSFGAERIKTNERTEGGMS